MKEEYIGFKYKGEVRVILDKVSGFIMHTNGHDRGIMSEEEYSTNAEELPGRYAMFNAFCALGGFPGDRQLTNAYERLATECMLMCQREVTPFEILEGDASNLKKADPELIDAAGFWNMAHPFIETQRKDDNSDEVENVIKIILIGFVDVTQVESPEDIKAHRSLLNHYRPMPSFIHVGDDEDGNPKTTGVYNFDLRPIVFDSPEDDEEDTVEEEGELDEVDSESPEPEDD